VVTTQRMPWCLKSSRQTRRFRLLSGSSRLTHDKPTTNDPLMNCSLPHLGVRLPLPWWPVLLCIGASCVDVTPPWQQSGRRDASDVSAVWLPDTGVEDTGGTPGGMAGIGGTGGLALDGRGGSGGVEGEVGLPSTDGEVDVSVGDAPVVLDAGQTGSVDARSAGDVGLDGFGDLPLGGGGAGGSGGDARRDAGSGGQAGSGGAIDRGGTGGRGGPWASADPSQKSVWVLKDGKAKPVRLKTGVSDGSWTEVVQGELAEGDLVITDIASGAAKTTQATPPGGAMPRRMF